MSPSVQTDNCETIDTKLSQRPGSLSLSFQQPADVILRFQDTNSINSLLYTDAFVMKIIFIFT